MTRKPQPNRLDKGGLIDRGRPLTFRFDGKELAGYAGDTLASALVANRVRTIGRSFKYHRPRGILTAGAEEPNALVTLGEGAEREPNSKATVIELFDGLDAHSQNCWPSPGFDLMAVNGLLSPLFAAGFYYKTFMWPTSFWEKLYEPLIRRAAGLGALSGDADPDCYEKAHAFCEILIIGSGPAGLMAALTAARSGARVILCESDFRLGGRLLAERHEVAGQDGVVWLRSVEQELETLPNLRIMRRTSIFGLYDGNVFGAVEQSERQGANLDMRPPRQRFWKIVTKRTLLATGAIEQPVVFGGNDRPGVMMASAAQSYVTRFAAAPGQRGVVFTTTDSGWAAAADLITAGLEITAVIDPRPAIPTHLAQTIESAGASCMSNAQVVATHGWQSVNGVTVRDQQGRTRRIAVDLLAVSGGWNPAIGLACHLGARPTWSDQCSAYLLEKPPAQMTIIGAANGRFTLRDCLADGYRAAIEAAEDLGLTAPSADIPATNNESAGQRTFCDLIHPRGKAFVDLQHDVTAADVALAVREGYRSVELLKRYTTLGMATDQGKTASVNGNILLAAETGRAIADVGTILSRPPYVPIPIAVFAGDHRGVHFRPVRRTPSHAWAEEQRAVFTDTGQWKRALWFPRPGETDWLQTVNREVSAVRTGVGLCDLSTLGKIDLQGPDVGAFLDRIYINGFSQLAVGKARYGVMLREDGMVMDDGTTARLADEHYVMTTTTANAAKVMQHLEFCHQVLWPSFDLRMISVTEQWAQFAIAGPQSRRLLQNILGPDFDLSNDAFPYLAAGAVAWRGVGARLFRLSFSGELAYELAVPASYGDALIRDLMRAGQEFSATPYGTEALGVMRIEKGHAAGNELNGQTTAGDLGLGGMMSKKKDFIGRILSCRPGLIDPSRPRLVGVKPIDPSHRLSGGAHFLPLNKPAIAAHDEGYLTSAAFSPTLGHSIGLGLLKHGPERIGDRIRAVDLLRGRDVEVEICPPCFFDPKGDRLRV